MKYIIGMVVVFCGLYIILYYDMFSFFAQPWLLKFTIILDIILTLLAIAVIVYLRKKRGGKNGKN